MKIAIIGGGISGITCAWYLQNQHDVTLYENNDYLGGHTHTTYVNLPHGSQAVDTGFAVFNDRSYPAFTNLLNEWDVPFEKSEMSCSVTFAAETFQYHSNLLSTLFSQNPLNWQLYTMWADIFRFNRRAIRVLKHNLIPDTLSVARFIDELKLGEYFKNRYFYPIASAIWSSTPSAIKNFPAYFLLRFFYNHGLLGIKGHPQWFFIPGGSQQYVKTFIAQFKGKYLLNSSVTSVIRTDNQVEITVAPNQIEYFDMVIFACHANEVLTILQNQSTEEREVLAMFPYQQNQLILHNDTNLMPKKRSSWAGWNYLLDEIETTNSEQKLPIITYYLNKLQNIPQDTPLFASLNAAGKIQSDKIIQQFTYWHPVFCTYSIDGQQKIKLLNEQKNIRFCGAYCGFGSHEDAVTSALKAIKDLL